MKDVRRKIWNDMLDADLNRRYFGVLSGRYYKIDLYSKVFLAIMASGTVAGWVIWTDGVKYPYGALLWKSFSAASALVSVVLPLINVTKKFEAAARLKNDWYDIMQRYEALWLRLDTLPKESALEISSSIIQHEVQIAAIENILPTENSAIIRRCVNDVKVARGL